jgi:hypothetical protein
VISGQWGAAPQRAGIVKSWQRSGGLRSLAAVACGMGQRHAAPTLAPPALFPGVTNRGRVRARGRF